jgi:uncharacterized protein (TIGR02145 family)
MAENLDYGSYVLSTPTSTLAAGQKYCWSNNPDNCTINHFGGLYEWEGMMNGAASCNGADSTHPACANPVQGICPSGWHVPSHYEFTLLERNVGSTPFAFPYNTTTAAVWLGSDEATNLRSTDFGGPLPSWSPGGGAVAGTNLSGFNALMAQYENAGLFPNIGSISTWYWSSTEIDASTAFSRSIWHNFGSVRRSIDTKDRGYSVRCVKD